MRIWAIAKALELGMNVAEVHTLTSIDRLFLSQLDNIHVLKCTLKSSTMAELSTCPQVLHESKREGFAGRQIAVQFRFSDPGCSATILTSGIGASRKTSFLS